MKTVEFQSVLTPEQTLAVPAGAAEKIPQGQPVRVLVLLGDEPDQREWEELAAADFAEGYADSDAIYDQLSRR